MNKITNKSLFDLKNVTQPVVVGDDVYYVETEIDQEENNYLSSIYRLNLNTKEITLFGDTGDKNLQIKLTPDKKNLAYLSNNTVDEKMQLFIMPLDGGAAKQITEEKNGISNYLFVADSQTIYYQTTIEKEEQDDKEEDKSEFPTKNEFTKLQYKADGQGIISEDVSYQIKKVSIDMELETLNHDLVLEEERALNLGYVAKDESYLLYFDRFDPKDEWLYGGSMFKYDVNEEKTKLLTSKIPSGIFNFSLAAADEHYFLFTGNDFKYKFVTNNHIYGFDPKTEEINNLTGTLDFSVGDSLVGDFQQNVGGEHVWWLKDGESFLFLATEHGKTTLYIGNIDGELTKVFNKELHITGLDFLEGKDKIVITYSTLTNPSALAIVDLTTSELKEIYNPNKNFLKEHTITKPERFWFKSLKDWAIQGWYVPPVEQKKNHPAILYIHGGPQVSYGETFFHEMQVLSASGYGIIMLNPRGGSGYGQEFVASILNNYGDEDYQDLMNGLDFVLEEYPEIDPENVYVAGGSYGGFMTNWIVTHTNRFKAAVTQRSISNWISFYGTSDIGPSFVEFQLGRDLSDVEGLWKMSPLAHAKHAETPILILHGEEDLRCPQEQAEQMYIAMKKHGVETRLVTFPKSAHGLSREGLPNLRLERLEEISNWFENH